MNDGLSKYCHKGRVRVIAGMKRLLATTMCCLSLATCGVAYSMGRYAMFDPIPAVIPAFLLYVAAVVCYLIAALVVTRSWRGWVSTLLLAGASFALIRIPSWFGDGYFEMGRRAHIKSIFTPDVVNDIKARVRSMAISGTRGTDGELEPDDMPFVVSESAWRFPGYASFSYEPSTQKTVIQFDWGGALIAHHGIIITDEVIPFRGYPTHAEDENGNDVEMYSKRYYPWVEGSYIVIDEN